MQSLRKERIIWGRIQFLDPKACLTIVYITQRIIYSYAEGADCMDFYDGN
jgi:hypothetical protein